MLQRKFQLIGNLSLILVFILGALAFRMPASAVVGIPEGATITSATFSIYVIDTGIYTVRAHRITADWQEMVVTLNNFADAYDPAILGSFVPNSLGWKSVDVTGLVQDWVDGATPNFGILIEQDDIGLAAYTSSDFTGDTALRPKLDVCYTHPSGDACVTIQRPSAAAEDVFDSYVWEFFPNNNYGAEPDLFTGRVSMAIKYSLLKFDFDIIQQPKAAIGDFVWHDEDADGIQDDGENGIEGVLVELYTCDGAFVDSMHTNADGYYLFSGLTPGSYYVKFYTPDGFFISPLNQGGDPELDSDADPLTGMTICTTLDPGETDLSWDAGLYQKAAIGDFVWFDMNNNGIQDFGEDGVEGVLVELYTCDGAFVSSMYTNADGYYLFNGLMPGAYYVKFYTPDGYTFSPLNQGGDPELDSDADPLTGMTVCTTLTSGETDLSWDAGLYKPMYTNPGTGTPGYWKNHPEAWPVETITIGGVLYTKEQAINWMSRNDRLDKTITMFRALVAAKLNVLIGNDPTCIADTIAAADAWMATYGPVGSGVHASSAAWQMGEPLYWAMDDYNNGMLCAPSRD